MPSRFFPAAACALALLIACPPAGAEVPDALYTPARVASELESLARRYPAHLRIERIGTSALGRPLLVARLGARPGARRPVVFALFGQHPDEHDMNALGMYFIQRLAERHGQDAEVTALLARSEIAVMPMANPDGTVYDLDEAPQPFEWRRNRRPHAQGVGANLNGNWGGDWRPGTAASWTGEAAFSEPETRAIRDWRSPRSLLGAAPERRPRPAERGHGEARPRAAPGRGAGELAQRYAGLGLDDRLGARRARRRHVRARDRARFRRAGSDSICPRAGCGSRDAGAAAPGGVFGDGGGAHGGVISGTPIEPPPTGCAGARPLSSRPTNPPGERKGAVGFSA